MTDPIAVLALCLAAAAGSPGAPARAVAPAPVAATAQTVLAEIRKPGASVVLVNVWATWCAPCREEFPDILKVARELAPRGIHLVLVSADFEGSEPEVRSFLAEQGVEFQTFLRTGKDEAFIDGLSTKWSGAIPASFVYDRSGKLVRFWEGKASYADIKGRVLAALDAKESR